MGQNAAPCTNVGCALHFDPRIVSVPTQRLGHHRYAPALPHQQNAFGALASRAGTDNDSVETVATQVAALTNQSQLMASMAADNSQCQEI
jgi:hypothetical protein